MENFRHRELISVKSARTVVAGREARQHDPSVFSTLATTIVEGLDIMGVVTADRVVARLTTDATRRRASGVFGRGKPFPGPAGEGRGDFSGREFRTAETSRGSGAQIPIGVARPPSSDDQDTQGTRSRFPISARSIWLS